MISCNFLFLTEELNLISQYRDVSDSTYNKAKGLLLLCFRIYFFFSPIIFISHFLLFTTSTSFIFLIFVNLSVSFLAVFYFFYLVLELWRNDLIESTSHYYDIATFLVEERYWFYHSSILIILFLSSFLVFIVIDLVELLGDEKVGSYYY